MFNESIQRKAGMRLLHSGLMQLWVAVLVIVIDRYSKIWILHHFTPYEPVRIFSFFNLTLAYNKGAAFGFLNTASGWQGVFLGTLAVIVSVAILSYLAKSALNERWLNTALCLIIGGALGNVWDRLQYGYVIDFLNFHLNDWHFAIFNIADSAISIGTVMLILHWLRPGKASTR